jgi:SAM-dependent methyltransferase
LGIWARAFVKRMTDPFLSLFDMEAFRREDVVDYYLHTYKSYEEYRQTQITHNIRKIKDVWADEATLELLCGELRKDIPGEGVLSGICHGTRNGFEQNFISTQPGFEAIGTDISATAKDFERSVQWDFHDVREDWEGKFDFVYSNSLDQSWNPRSALVTWLNQLKPGGRLVIEHTIGHGPANASEMDPFGVRPQVMPYVLVQWFGTDVSMRFVHSKKANNDLDVWLFLLKRNVSQVV